MMYVIGQISIFLLLTAASAAFAGWMFAAHRAAPARQALRRRRERLVQDLAMLAAGEGRGADFDAARDAERVDSLSRIRESRIAELERALQSARARADGAAAEAAELRRRFEQAGDGGGEDPELARLRALVAEHEQERAREIETEAQIVSDEDTVLQAWRLRYFEQRVRYLEDLARPPAAAPAPQSQPDMAQLEWRAREAEARAAHLEDELRARAAPAAEEAAPFAASADVDALLRWRLLYLERRVAHLQSQPAQPARATTTEATSDPDRWKWRARYLEARVRHLEQRPMQSPAPYAPEVVGAPAAPEPERPAPPRPSRPGTKPPVLASAHNGAPDDLTLIEDVSPLQQTALYALGVFHFAQIAAWTPDHVAWVDTYFRLRGRIDDEDWVGQADELAREGPPAARRALADESA